MNKDNNTKNTKRLQNLVLDKGINLIPPKTDVEIVTERVKGRVNISAAVSILVLVLGTLIIVGINAFSKLMLNNSTKELYSIERGIDSKKEILLNNEELVRKAMLYRDIEKSAVSYKSVITFWQGITGSLASMDNIEISNTLGFKISGSSDSFDNASKLWYLLANDSRVDTVVLKNIVSDSNVVRFTFEGELNYDLFVQQQ